MTCSCEALQMVGALACPAEVPHCRILRQIDECVSINLWDRCCHCVDELDIAQALGTYIYIYMPKGHMMYYR